jgi:alkaline phosphatase
VREVVMAQGGDMKGRRWKGIVAIVAIVGAAGAATAARSGFGNQDHQGDDRGFGFGGRRAKNVIFFIGDGMGVSTVTGARVFSVGVDGQLVLDQFPHTALSRTYSADSITPDSAPTMSAMMTGVNTNQSVIGFGENTEANDFNRDGDGRAPWTLLELAKRHGMKVGAVSTATITHATPAATYAHINQRNNEGDIALQALPTDPTYNQRLGRGVDLLMGGGRRFFLPNTLLDEEGVRGARADGRDLRAEFKAAGYNYVWNKTGFDAIKSLPALGLFESSHMEFEYDRPSDLGGEPSLKDMTVKAIQLMETATRRRSSGYFLHVEAGRIDHAHHAGNAYRAMVDAQELDQAIGAAAQIVDLRETLIIVSADHSHVFNITGYPLRPLQELPYPVKSYEPGYEKAAAAGHGLLDIVWDIDQTTGHVFAAGDRNGVPYTVLGYHNGPGYRGALRVDPRTDLFKGLGGVVPDGPTHPAYFQEAAVPLGSETHAGEDVAIYAIGPGSELVKGTVKNTHIFHVMKRALGFD